VPLFALPACEQIDLTLPAAPFSAGIQVEHAQGCGLGHLRRMRGSSSARNAVQHVPAVRRLPNQST
jgi:hypothetical protein